MATMFGTDFVQAYLQNAQQRMLEDKDPAIKALKKTMVADLENNYVDRINAHSAKLDQLEAEGKQSSPSYTYHKRMREYYQS